ncbi:MAG TPA: hypothetical protein VI700_04690, partial [Thermoanaerobaculaceae bacterium]|nr:hypothetical protein [Thermoanaerobaculaceae bacterium]
FAHEAGRPLLLVMTKTDRLGRGELARAAQRLARELGTGAAPLAFSARTGAGRKDVLAAIARALAA